MCLHIISFLFLNCSTLSNHLMSLTIKKLKMHNLETWRVQYFDHTLHSSNETELLGPNLKVYYVMHSTNTSLMNAFLKYYRRNGEFFKGFFSQGQSLLQFRFHGHNK